MDKDFDTLYIDGLSYKLTIYISQPAMYTQSHHTVEVERLRSSCKQPRHLVVVCVWGSLIFPVPFSLYVNDMLTPFHNVELALYTNDGPSWPRLIS